MIVNINKPIGMTSHDVVNEVRKITGEKRVGHAGTLDPFATGVLVIGISRESTKQLHELTNSAEKEYIAKVEFGKKSTTGDPEGTIREIAIEKAHSLTKETLSNILPSFTGDIQQTPPIYSAIKVEGKPAYSRARKGETVELPERTIHIYNIEVIEFSAPFATLQITSSSGTYIRSLAQDIGEKLGLGAYLVELERIRVGEHKIEDSISLADLKKQTPIPQ